MPRECELSGGIESAAAIHSIIWLAKCHQHGRKRRHMMPAHLILPQTSYHCRHPSIHRRVKLTTHLLAEFVPKLVYPNMLLTLELA